MADQLVNSQLIRLRPVGILNPFLFDLINLFQEFAQPQLHFAAK